MCSSLELRVLPEKCSSHWFVFISAGLEILDLMSTSWAELRSSELVRMKVDRRTNCTKGRTLRRSLSPPCGHTGDLRIIFERKLFKYSSFGPTRFGLQVYYSNVVGSRYSLTKLITYCKKKIKINKCKDVQTCSANKLSLPVLLNALLLSHDYQ